MHANLAGSYWPGVGTLARIHYWRSAGSEPGNARRSGFASAATWPYQSSNCASSVEPVSAVTDDWPPWITMVT